MTIFYAFPEIQSPTVFFSQAQGLNRVDSWGAITDGRPGSRSAICRFIGIRI
jgi:hypothetical protein